jgi:hypothetical protein
VSKKVPFLAKLPKIRPFLGLKLVQKGGILVHFCNSCTKLVHVFWRIYAEKRTFVQEYKFFLLVAISLIFLYSKYKSQKTCTFCTNGVKEGFSQNILAERKEQK